MTRSAVCLATEDRYSTIPLGDDSTGLPEDSANGSALMRDGRVALSIGDGIYRIGPQGRVVERVPLKLEPAPALAAAMVKLDGRDLFARVQPVGLVWIDGLSKRAYPVALPGPRTPARLKRLIDRCQPALVSEHLSWGSVQDFLGRRILIENPSSYLRFNGEVLTEWEFLEALAAHADCGLLVDVNNVFVGARLRGARLRCRLGSL